MKQLWRIEYGPCRFCKQRNIAPSRSKSGLCTNCRSKFHQRGWDIHSEPPQTYEELYPRQTKLSKTTRVIRRRK